MPSGIQRRFAGAGGRRGLGSFLAAIMSGSALPFSSDVKTTTYTSTIDEIVLYDPSGGTFTLKPKATPSKNDRWGVMNTTADTTAITIDGNGENIQANNANTPGVSFSQLAPRGVLIWQYSGTEWVLITPITDTDLSPSSETLTGETFDGKSVYRNTFSGTSMVGNQTLDASAIYDKILDATGYQVHSDGLVAPVEQSERAPTEFGLVYVSSGNQLVYYCDTSIVTGAFKFSVRYTKL